MIPPRACIPGRIAAALAAGLLLAHCARVPVGDGAERVPMADPQEIELGRQAHQALLEEYAAVDRPALQTYVEGVGQRLAQQSARAGLPWRFTVLDSPDVNAFALPDGHVYLTRGILAYLNSEAELAAVIAHEIGHVTARHGVQQPNVPAPPALESVLAPPARDRAGTLALQRLAPAWARGYGAEQELEAGRLAAATLAAVGYPPQAVAAVAATLKAHAAVARELPGGHLAAAHHAVFDTDLARLARVVARSKAVAAPREGRDDYLQVIAGLHFGDSPDQGVLRDNLLLHARLGLAMQFPPGWGVHNRADRVVAMHPAGDALLELRPGPSRGQPLDALQKGVRLDPGARYDTGRLGGFPAAFAAGARGGRPVVATAVALDSGQYVIAGMARDVAAYERERSALRAAINSFHAISPAEKRAARTYSLQLITVRAGQTMAGLARQSPLSAGAEVQLRLMNGLYPNGEPEPGQALKIVQ